VSKVLLCLFLLCSLVMQSGLVTAQKENSITISVAVSPEASYMSTIPMDKGLAKRLLRCKTVTTSEAPELPRATIAIGKRTFVLDSMSRLFEPQRKQLVLLPSPLQRELTSWMERAEQAHFGRLRHWDEVRKDFQRMSYATVIDLETGEQFRVQRRAGSRHADVQPLTRDDTKIMKSIYNGKWSWKRRAILVRLNGNTYAASMHGMPHGAGAIVGNQFPGHFCIHFYGSTTHRRNEPDPSHSLMIVKASGKLPETVMNADPQQLIDYFLTSLHENDPVTMRMTTNGFALPEELSHVLSVRRVQSLLSPDSVQLLTAEIPVRVDYFHRQKGNEKRVWVFLLARRSLFDRWKITGLEIGS
jgi:hypothetical protein